MYEKAPLRRGFFVLVALNELPGVMDLAGQQAVVREPSGRDVAAVDRCEQGAAGLGVMLAVAEAAVSETG